MLFFFGVNDVNNSENIILKLPLLFRVKPTSLFVSIVAFRYNQLFLSRGYFENIYLCKRTTEMSFK